MITNPVVIRTTSQPLPVVIFADCALVVDAVTSGMQEAPADRLRKAIQRKGISQSDLARAAGTDRQTLYRILIGKQQLTREYALIYAPHLNVTAEWLMFGERNIPIVGLLNRECVVTLFSESEQNNNELIPMPPGGTIHTVAVEIQGGALGPQFNGWLAFYDDRKLPPTDSILGKLCAVGLADGTVMVKTVMLGRIAGHYDLWAPNTEPMQDIPILWASRITTISEKTSA